MQCDFAKRTELALSLVFWMVNKALQRLLSCCRYSAGSEQNFYKIKFEAVYFGLVSVWFYRPNRNRRFGLWTQAETSGLVF